MLRDIFIKNYSLADLDRDMDAWWGGGMPTATGLPISETGALRHITVYSCVRVRSETFASFPLSVYRRRPGGKGRDEATDHLLYNILHAAPNEEMTSMSWREAMNGHLDLSGNCYSIITTNRRGQVIDVYPWDWRLIEPRRNLETGKLEYHLNDRGKTEILPPERVFHVPGFSYNGLRGYSIIRLAAEAVAIGLSISEFTARFFGQGMNIGALLETDKPFKDLDAINDIRDQFVKKYSGLANSHMPMILHGGLKYTRIPMPLNDAQFIETTKLNMDQLCGLYRVPPHLVANLDRATFCLPAGTEVMTENGPVPVESIRPGVLVWSLNNLGHWVKSRVKHSLCTGEDKVLRIRTTNRTVRANARHRFLVRRKHNIPHSGRGGHQAVEWRNEYVPAEELRVGDVLVCMDGLPTKGTKNTPTRRLSVGFMEFCGLAMGDGNVYSTGAVSIARGYNALYMDHYRRVIQSEFSRYDGGNGRGDQAAVALAPVTLQEGDRQTRFSSVLAARELISLGIKGNARTKSVPDWVFPLTEDLRLAFLRGFLDADGSVNEKGRINFSSCNRVLLSQMRHLCMSCAIPVTNLRVQRGKTTLPNGEETNFAQWSFTCSNPKDNARIGSNDPRYQARLIAGNPFNRKGRKYPRYGGRGFSLEGCSLSRIYEIKPEPSEPVFDLEVEDTHNFVADGVVVHNSNIEHMSLEFVMYSMLPLVTRFEQTMNWKLFTPAERAAGYYAKFNMDGLLRGDAKSRAEALNIKRQNGVINADGWRELDDDNPIGGLAGEAYLVNGNMISTETAAKQQPKQTGQQPQQAKRSNINIKSQSQNDDDLEKVMKVINSLSKEEKDELGPRYFYDDAQYRYIEESDDEPVAFIENRATGKKGHFNIAVHPDHRGEGIADKMVDEAIGAAPDLDLEKIFWITKSTNEASRNLAEKHGFELDSEEDGTVKYVFML